jgi:hypothetical protein
MTNAYPYCADVISPADIADLDSQALGKLSLKTVQKSHWGKVMAHAAYLKAINFDKPPSPLMLWLERYTHLPITLSAFRLRPDPVVCRVHSWRLQRLQPGLFALGVDVKEDIIDLDASDMQPLNLKLLEIKRWKRVSRRPDSAL